MNDLPTGMRPEILVRALADMDPALDATERLNRLIHAGLDRLPLPGRGSTLLRWQALSAVAACDLSLAKLYEGHTDALAILAELGDAAAGAGGSPRSWGVWAAEAPQGRTMIEADSLASDGAVRLTGAKHWCSGAAGASDALLTAWHADGRGPQLVALSLRQPGVWVSSESWRALGMAGSASLDVAFDRPVARLVGAPGDYLNRPGFWHGGAGIAACWYGGTLAIAGALRREMARGAPASNSSFRLAALGRLDVSLLATAAVLRECAAWIDAHPEADASAVALRACLCAENSATLTLTEVGRALGATPFCRDAHFARTAADLPVFIRQSHAERDLAALGEKLIDSRAWPWAL